MKNHYRKYILIIINQDIVANKTQNILKSAKKFYEKLYTIDTTSKSSTTEFLSKILKRKKICNEQCNLFEVKISLDEIIKSIYSQTNNKSPGNYGFTTEYYEHFSNKLVPVLLVFMTPGETSRTGIISVICKKGEDIANYGPTYYNS